MLPQPFQHLQVPVLGGAAHVISSHGQSSCRAHRNTSGYPPTAASVQRCHYAVDEGRLDVLRWAIEHGCPGDWQYAHHLA